ncbi:unnamed protein product, partial [Symbiodinium natans]
YLAVDPGIVAEPPAPSALEEQLEALPTVNVNAIWDELLLKIENRRTAYDRWGTRILLFPLYGPLLLVVAYYGSGRLRRAARWLQKHPLVVEAAGYAGSFLLAARGRRTADVGLAYGGALAFAACHAASVQMRRPAGKPLLEQLRPSAGDAVLWLFLHAACWAALCVAHVAPWAGLAAMLLLLSALVMLLFDLGFAGDSGEDGDMWVGLWQISSTSAAASAAIFVVCCCLGSRLQAFAFGACCCGHFTLLLAMLLLGLGFSESYVRRQALALLVFLMGCGLGYVWDAPGLLNSALSFLLLWFLTKCLEGSWSNHFVALLALYAVGQLFYSCPELLLHALRAENLYT